VANVKPSKEKSREKIDGVSALVDAMDQLIRAPIPATSPYEGRGLLVL
jgi:phage terminase large subunit-like protein